MEAGNSSSPGRDRQVVTLADASGARMVLRSDRRRFLEPFLGRDRSASQAARDVGVRVEEMAYRVRAMARAGLLQVVERQARAGREILVYRAAHEVRAPLRVLDEGDVREFFRTVDEPMREAFFAALARRSARAGLGDWVVRLYRDDQDRIRVDLAPDGGDWDPGTLAGPTAPAVAFHWVPLALSAAEAKDLQRELLALLGRYGPRVPVAGRSPTHLLGLFLTATD